MAELAEGRLWVSLAWAFIESQNGWGWNDLKTHLTPTSCLGQRHFPLDQGSPSDLQRGLGHSRSGQDFYQGEDFPSSSQGVLAGMGDGGVWALSIPDVPAGAATSAVLKVRWIAVPSDNSGRFLAKL